MTANFQQYDRRQPFVRMYTSVNNPTSPETLMLKTAAVLDDTLDSCYSDEDYQAWSAAIGVALGAATNRVAVQVQAPAACTEVFIAAMNRRMISVMQNQPSIDDLGNALAFAVRDAYFAAYCSEDGPNSDDYDAMFAAALSEAYTSAMFAEFA